MTHLLGVFESLVRDAWILGRSVGATRGRAIRSILGTEAGSEIPGRLSELAYFQRLLDERRRDLAPLGWRSPGDVWNAVKSADRLRARFVPLPVLGDRPSSLRQHSAKAFPREAWFFVNGVATDREVLQLNGEYLVKLFQRPIELIYNPTDGVVLDLLECVIGRTFDFASETADYTLERVAAALADPDKQRVVLMGHSQGGIIVANVVAALIDRHSGDPTRLGKLEVYTFASASDHMPVDPRLDRPDRHVPFIEHFANTGDLVALLGVLERRLPIRGKVYSIDKPGHLLNAHYLNELEGARRFAWPGPDGKWHTDARLYGYLDGRTPAALPLRGLTKAANSSRRAKAVGSASRSPATGRSRRSSGSPREGSDV